MDEDGLSTLYKNRFAAQELQRKNAIWKVLCEYYFQQYVSSNDTVVDLACGYGEFINNIQAGEKLAIDLNPDSRAYLAEGVRFEQLPATELGSLLAGSADASLVPMLIGSYQRLGVLAPADDPAPAAAAWGPLERVLGGQRVEWPSGSRAAERQSSVAAQARIGQS